MSKETVSKNTWTLQPLDPACNEPAERDQKAVTLIQTRLPDWSGDPDELLDDLIKLRNLSPTECHKLTGNQLAHIIHRIGLEFGTTSTSLCSVVLAPPQAQSQAETRTAEVAADTVGRQAEDKLLSSHWQILDTCERLGFTDAATARPQIEIAAWVQGNGKQPLRGNVREMRRQFATLVTLKLLGAEPGIGTWIEQKGVEAVKDRREQRQRLPRVV